MYSSEILDEVVRKAKIEAIMLDVIELKQENRNIGAKIKLLYHNLSANTSKLVLGGGAAGYTYGGRLLRDFKTIEYLEKLQRVNSRLINKHRSKVRALREGLGLLKGAE